MTLSGNERKRVYVRNAKAWGGFGPYLLWYLSDIVALSHRGDIYREMRSRLEPSLPAQKL